MYFCYFSSIFIMTQTDSRMSDVLISVDVCCHDDCFSLTVKLGQRHPDPVVETSSLSSVEPSNIWYHLSIPESTIDYGYLSALQLEAVVYTCQKHQVFLPSGDRAGFLIGQYLNKLI